MIRAMGLAGPGAQERRCWARRRRTLDAGCAFRFARARSVSAPLGSGVRRAVCRRATQGPAADLSPLIRQFHPQERAAPGSWCPHDFVDLPHVQARTGNHFSELQLGAGGLTSTLLAPGDYELCVFGNCTAEQTVPFSIRANEETKFELRLSRGVRQRFEIAIAAAVSVPDGGSISLLVNRGEDIVRRRSLGAPKAAGSRRTGEVWITPGTYTVTASCGSLTTTVPFDVGIEEGPAVQVELQ